jgi:PAS domain S-box-containing protein
MITPKQKPEHNLEKKILEQEILIDLNQSILNTLDLQKILQIISDGISKLLENETAAIYLLEDDENLFLGATTPSIPKNMPDQLRFAKLKNHPHIEEALKSGKPIVIQDTLKAKLSKAEQEVVEIRQLKSLLFLPIIIEKQELGVLILGTNSTTRQYSDYDVKLGHTVANQVSVGIINAKLHASLAKKNKQLIISRAHLSNALKIAKLGNWEFIIDEDMFILSDEFFKLFETNNSIVGSRTLNSKQFAEKFLHPDEKHIVEEEIQKSLNLSNPDTINQFEHKIIKKDGEYGHFKVLYRIIKDVDGKTVKAYGITQDITERKINEKKLLEAIEKAEESDRLKTAFLANLSHEIRTPMNSIVGFTNLLKQNGLSELEKKSYLEFIEKGSDRLLRLISDIIQISKIDASFSNIYRKSFLLNTFIEDLHKNFSSTLSKKEISITTEIALSDLESRVYTDMDRLYQVFANLLENAIKFTKSGTINFGYIIKKGKLVMFVSDPGIGIEKRYHDKIFERFWQVEPENHTIISGTGLGLSIVKMIIELLNGDIWVESELKHGTTFFFTIPSLLVKESIN